MTPPPTEQPRSRRGLRWLALAAAAALLLGLSQALWLWQTWPVRDLLERTAPGAPARPVS